MYSMLRWHIILLIAIRPSDGDVKPGGPLGDFREEQAMSRHRFSSSPFLSSPSLTTQLHYTNSYTYSHPNLNFLEYTIQILNTHEMWAAQSVRDSKIDHTQFHLSALRGTRSASQCSGLTFGTNKQKQTFESLCIFSNRMQRLIKIYSTELFLNGCKKRFEQNTRQSSFQMKHLHTHTHTHARTHTHTHTHIYIYIYIEKYFPTYTVYTHKYRIYAYQPKLFWHNLTSSM